jgi:hypothetical protein
VTVGASVIMRSPDVREESRTKVSSELAQCRKYISVERKKKFVWMCVCVCPREEGTELVSVRVWER